MNKPLLDDDQLHAYLCWQTHRDHIEFELLKIEKAIRSDPTQIDECAESIFDAIDSLKQIIPELKMLGRDMQQRAFSSSLIPTK